jgi:hypothetical protein
VVVAVAAIWVRAAALAAYKTAERFLLVQELVYQLQWAPVLLKYQLIHNLLTTAQTPCLDLLRPTAAVVVGHGTVMQAAQAHRAAAVVLDLTDRDPTVILDQMIAETKIMVAEEL